MAAISRLVCTPAGLRSPRRRNPLKEPMLTPAGRSQDGRRFVPPGKRPSTGVAARKGRERPRLGVAPAAPRRVRRGRSRPRVGVEDVLGRGRRGVRVPPDIYGALTPDLRERLCSDSGTRFCRGSPGDVGSHSPARKATATLELQGRSQCRRGALEPLQEQGVRPAGSSASRPEPSPCAPAHRHLTARRTNVVQTR